jgi:uncharacterized heparinase superfamily protein
MNEESQPDLPLKPPLPSRDGADDGGGQAHGLARGGGHPPPAIARESAWSQLLRAFGLSGARREGLRLLAVPDDPLPADAVRGNALRAGHFYFRGIRLDIDRLGRAPPLPDDFDAYINGFDWLRDLGRAAPLPEVRPLAERIAIKWLRARGS